MVELLLENHSPDDCLFEQSLLDSMPIITCSGKKQAKVATELTDKGYCSTKGMYYYGMKLHALGFRRKGTLPHPEQIFFTPAAVSSIRQPIEALLSWLIRKTDIQRANLVRSPKGLLIHVFGKLDAAFVNLAF